MAAVDASIVLLPRFTTLVANQGAQGRGFMTLPIDVSRYGGAQIQVYSASLQGTGSVYVRFSESLDTERWTLGPSTPSTYLLNPGSVTFFSYTFRLRWFRMEVVVTGNEAVATVWADGLLRGGGSGPWTPGAGPDGVPADQVAGRMPVTPPPTRPGPDLASRWGKSGSLIAGGLTPPEPPSGFHLRSK